MLVIWLYPYMLSLLFIEKANITDPDQMSHDTLHL